MENKELPRGWIETTVNEIAFILRGISYSKNDERKENFENACLVLRGGNIQDGSLIFERNDNVFVNKNLVEEKQFLKEGDVIIVGSTGSEKLLGKAGQSFETLDSVSFGAFLKMLRPIEPLNKKYFGYFFQTDFYRNEMRAKGGGININNIRDGHLLELPILLPPLAEQTRIVTEIETVLSWVSEAQEELDKIPALLRAFRQKVLAMAVSGELTRDFRENTEGVIILKNWEILPLKDVNEVVTDGDHLPPPRTSEGVAFIVISNLKNDEIVFNNERFVSKKYYENLKEYRKPRINDILFSVTGSIGITVLIEDEMEFCFQRHIGLLRPNKKILPKFLKLSMQAPDIQTKSIELARGVAQLTLSLGELRNMKISVPPITEQTEIVKRVEALFDWLDIVEAAYTEGVSQLKVLPQSLLHKAFSGQLVAQDPTDEPASVLLERIQAEKKRQTLAAKEGKTAGRKFPKKKEKEGNVEG